MSNLKNKLLPVIPVIIALIGWQFYVQATHNELLPGPLSSLKALIDLATSHVLIIDCLSSLKRVFIGFCFAAVTGIVLGLAMGLIARLRMAFVPIIELLRPIPPLAWIPIAITLFGIGDLSSSFVIFIGAFYPIFTNTLLGVREVPITYIDAAKMLGASNWRIYRQVILPSALPSIFAGLRIGLGTAWACVVAAEMIAARSGLGYEIQLNRQLLQLDRVVAGMAVIGLIGVTMNTLMHWLELYCLPWEKISGAGSGLSEPRPYTSLAPTSPSLPDRPSELINLASTNVVPTKLLGAAVQLDKVAFSYGSTNIIDDISLSIKPSEFFCLLGSSGCGKTSLLRLIAGLNQPTAGKVTINGGMIVNHRSEITMVFQAGALFPWLTALENIAFSLQSRGLSKTKALVEAKSILAIVSLTHLAAHYPNQLSGGQQQRIALARALAYQPHLILLDEPFAALDSQTRELLQEDISLLLANMGVTVILVTHDIREAVFMADRVAVMSRGRIVNELTIDLARPREDSCRYSQQFSKARATLWDTMHGKNSSITTAQNSMNQLEISQC